MSENWEKRFDYMTKNIKSRINKFKYNMNKQSGRTENKLRNSGHVEEKRSNVKKNNRLWAYKNMHSYLDRTSLSSIYKKWNWKISDTVVFDN